MANIGLACPTCEAANGTIEPLFNTPGKFGYSCKNLHVFRDTEELLALKPTKINVPMKVSKPAGTRADLTLSLPVPLITALRERFKDKLEVSLTPILTSMLDPNAFLMGGFDFDRLGTLFGEKVKGPDQLYGLCWSLKQDKENAVREAQSAKTNSPTSQVETNEVNGEFVQVALRIPLEEYMSIKDKAKFNGTQTTAYLAQIISHGLTSGWF